MMNYSFNVSLLNIVLLNEKICPQILNSSVNISETLAEKNRHNLSTNDFNVVVKLKWQLGGNLPS